MMARSVNWQPTFRTAGILGAVADAVALGAPFAWKAFWPTPIATIDEPDANAAIDGCFVAKGRVLPSTIWKPLWLIAARDGSGWRPLTKIDPSQGTWQHKTCVDGTQGRFRLALVVTDRERDDAFREKLREPPEEEPVPEWMTRRIAEEQCPARRRRHRSGFEPIPDGAKLVAAAAFGAAADHDDGPLCIVTPLYDYERSIVASSRSVADERKRRRRHDERRVLGGHGGLQGSVVRGVPAGGDRVGRGRP